MTSFRQIEANRRNARRSTGPITEEGKQRSRRNAVRHGLTAETVIGALEDAEDYNAFQAAIAASFDAETAVERELVLRLASLLWRQGCRADNSASAPPDRPLRSDPHRPRSFQFTSGTQVTREIHRNLLQ
jgi:hypothetical protein